MGLALGRLEHFSVEARRRVAQGAAALSARAPRVSGWSVGEHLHHVALVNGLTLHRIAKLIDGEADDEGGAPNLFGRIVLRFGWIPRGRGRAPEVVVPADEVPADDLREALDRADREVSATRARVGEVVACTRRLRHQRLGSFTPGEWVEFLAVHTRHHDKIVRDVERAV